MILGKTFICVIFWSQKHSSWGGWRYFHYVSHYASKNNLFTVSQVIFTMIATKKIFSNVVKITRHRGTGISTSTFFPLLQEQNNIRSSSNQGLFTIFKIPIPSSCFNVFSFPALSSAKARHNAYYLARQGPVLILNLAWSLVQHVLMTLGALNEDDPWSKARLGPRRGSVQDATLSKTLLWSRQGLVRDGGGFRTRVGSRPGWVQD